MRACSSVFSVRGDLNLASSACASNARAIQLLIVQQLQSFLLKFFLDSIMSDSNPPNTHADKASKNCNVMPVYKLKKGDCEYKNPNYSINCLR